MIWEQKRSSCFSYLERFKSELTEKQYLAIRQTIGSFAIENIFVTQEDVQRLVSIAKGEVTAEKAISEIKSRLKIVA